MKSSLVIFQPNEMKETDHMCKILLKWIARNSLSSEEESTLIELSFDDLLYESKFETVVFAEF